MGLAALSLASWFEVVLEVLGEKKTALSVGGWDSTEAPELTKTAWLTLGPMLQWQVLFFNYFATEQFYY